MHIFHLALEYISYHIHIIYHIYHFEPTLECRVSIPHNVSIFCFIYSCNQNQILVTHSMTFWLTWATSTCHCYQSKLVKYCHLNASLLSAGSFSAVKTQTHSLQTVQIHFGVMNHFTFVACGFESPTNYFFYSTLTLLFFFFFLCFFVIYFVLELRILLPS